MTDFKRLRVGYVPYSQSLDSPGDRRRFVFYAGRRGIPFEVADPSKKYDVVVASGNADLSLWTRYQGSPLFFDYIDSYFAVPCLSVRGLLRGVAHFSTGRSRWLQLIHRKSLERMFQRADAVICATTEQRQQVLPYCRNVHAILDSHALYHSTKTDYSAGDIFRLVWEGQPQNVEHFGVIARALKSVGKDQKLELNLVTNPRYFRFLGKVWPRDTMRVARSFFNSIHFHHWDEITSPSFMTSCDMAVIPLPLDDPFNAGKPENKLLIFWKMGIPAIVSATPAYSRAMKAAGLSMDCRTTEEWIIALEKFIKNGELRRQAGIQGKAFVETHHNDEILVTQWDALFSSIL
ncbi:MAG: hypothetical protein IPN19_06670 [Elusimicrobia bacterium]|nr:hypothetical protein [Elusimicrobiota bacterium]